MVTDQQHSEKIKAPIRPVGAAAAEVYLVASLLFSGTAWRNHPAHLSGSIDDLRHVLSRGQYHLPFSLIVDLHLLLEFGFETTFATDSEGGGIGDVGDVSGRDERALAVRYERECLGRILALPLFASAFDILVTCPDQAKARSHLLGVIVRRLAPFWPVRAQLNPGEIRELNLAAVIVDPSGAAAEFEKLFDLPSDTFFGEQLSEFLSAANEQLRWDDLITEDDLFELTNLQQLSSDHLRLGCRQLHELSRRLESVSLAELDLAPNEDGDSTAFLDETQYPTGGLAGMTNRGSFENLVLSELIYMDEVATERTSIFELRYLENELLFYLRDEGTLRRRRRTIHFIVDARDHLRRKTTGFDYQNSIVIQGLCLRIMADLKAIFPIDSVHFEFHFLPIGDEKFLEGEIEMLRVILADDVKHGWVKFHLPEDVDLISLSDSKRKSYAIIVSRKQDELDAIEEGESDVRDWKARLAAAAQEDPPLFGALLWLGAEEAMISDEEGHLPASGMSTSDLVPHKEALLGRLLS